MDRKKLNQIAIGIALFAIVVLVIAMLISGQAGRIWLPALSLAALIALVLLLLTDKKQPQAEAAAEETQTSAAQPELEQAAMIAGLAEDFDYIASADLEKNTITDRRRSPLLSECIDGWDDTVNYTAKMMLFADALVIPPEKESFLAKTDAKAIRAQLETCGAFYVDCPITLYGKERLYQLKLVSAAPDNSRVTIGFHSINDAAIKARRSVVQDIVMDGLTSDFECVSYVEFTGNRVTCCRISELFAKYIPGWRTVTDYAVRIRLLADALVVEEDRERFLFMTSPEQVMQGLSEDRVHYVVFRIRAEDATWIYQAKFISDPDDRSAVILGIHNVDREKKQEMERHAQEDAAHVRNEFFTQMSSDILGPLGSIQTVLHNARNNISDAENLQQSLEKADLTAQYLSGLVSDVLDMTRENGGGADVVREPMNMRVFVERCAAVIEEQAAEHRLRLDCYFDDIVHPHVRFDVSHLRQIVLNLLNNAVKYTPEGGKITFRVGELIAAEETVTFKIDIADTGHGMDRDILEHIWDVFALRADTSGDDSSGTGLGLAVCKMLADKMGATIAVDSKVGEGSCFTILLPAELDREAEQTQPADDVSILNGMHVLLAEDNELSRNLLKELLADAGAIITDAENGTVAL